MHPYYFIQITDGFAVAAIIFIWILILWNIKMKRTIEKLKSQNNELKGAIRLLTDVKGLDTKKDFTDGYY